MSTLTPRRLSETSRRVYLDGPLLHRLLQHWRPYICPFHEIIELVPPSSFVLDIGCGGGLFLALLASHKHIRGGLGFDASSEAIRAAKAMLAHLPDDHGLEFRHLRVTDPWPEGLYSVVSMIDVLHHIPVEAQRQVFMESAARVERGGHLLYKDLAMRPLWKAAANQLHDLVVAQQWIHLVAPSEVIKWAEQAELLKVTSRSIDVLCYRHEVFLFHRP